MPTEGKVTRKLRAILSADVKDYSLLRSDDEAYTIKKLEEYSADIDLICSIEKAVISVTSVLNPCF